MKSNILLKKSNSKKPSYNSLQTVLPRVIFENQTENIVEYKDQNEVAEFAYVEFSMSGKIWLTFWIVEGCFWQYLGVKYK